MLNLEFLHIYILLLFLYIIEHLQNRLSPFLYFSFSPTFSLFPACRLHYGICCCCWLTVPVTPSHGNQRTLCPTAKSLISIRLVGAPDCTQRSADFSSSADNIAHRTILTGWSNRTWGFRLRCAIRSVTAERKWMGQVMWKSNSPNSLQLYARNANSNGISNRAIARSMGSIVPSLLLAASHHETLS